MKKECVIVGAGTYGQVYAEYLKSDYEILGFVDDDSKLHNREINGYKVLGDFNFLVENIDRNLCVFVPIGNNKIRKELLVKLKYLGYKTPSFIHRDSNIHESVNIGECVYILPGTQIMPLTIVKDYVMISMGVNIAHHNLIEDGCFFSQGSNVGASIHFGTNVFCGISSTIMTGVKSIGDNVVVGAGSVVIRDVPNDATIIGVPGKILKINHEK